MARVAIFRLALYKKSRALNARISSAKSIIFGAMVGAFSLIAFPAVFITSYSAQVANLILTPFAAGAAMAALGAWRRHRDQELIRLDRFAYGYPFAVAMAAVRFVFGS